MTSGNLFSKALREDRKRRIWPFVLFALCCFMLTAVFELNLENYMSRELSFARIQENIEYLTANGMVTAYLVFAGIAACFYGFQGFAWLTKRDQVDFYHSQPMKREKRFFVIYLNGVIMCLMPMMIHVFVYTLLIGVRGYMNAAIMENILMNGMIFLLAFLVLYHLVILAVMLTGSMIVSIMIAGILFLYAAVLKFLVEGFSSTYFVTYTSGYESTTDWMEYFSPVKKLYQAGNCMIRGETEALTGSLLCLTVMAIVMIVTAFLLYKKRPSEAAGNALAFPAAGDTIRLLMVIPCGMLFGLLFASFGALSELFWLFFGTIVGVILGHGFMEVIFQFDIKAALKKKVQLGISILFVLCIVNVFYFDIFGYDRYIPEEDQVAEISYFTNIGEYNGNYRVLSDDGIPVAALESYYNDDNVSMYMYREEYQKETSATTQVEPILQLVRAHLDWESQGKMTENDYFQTIIHYTLKNGRDVYRTYTIAEPVLKEYYGPIFETEQGKKVIYPYLELSGEKAKGITVYAPFINGGKTLEWSEEQIKELVSCYREDIKAVQYEDLFTSNYYGQISLIYERANNLGTNSIFELDIYIASSYEKTLAYLEEKGVYMTLPNDQYTVMDIVVYNPYSEEETRQHPYWKGQDSVQMTAEEIDLLLPVMISDEYGHYYGRNTDYFINVSINVMNENTKTQATAYYHIPLQDTPEYMMIENQ